MNRFLRLLAVMGACLVMYACASERPAGPAAAPAKAVPPPAATSIATAPDSPGAAAAKPRRIVLEDKTLTNDEIKALFAQGYKPVGRDGKVYYCRREMLTGSRFSTTTCKTAEQMKQLTQDSKDLIKNTQRTGECRSMGTGC